MFPCLTRNGSRRWMIQKLVAHRGLHGPGRPENSLAAFEAALDRGFAMECDVRLLADGEVAVFHDTDLKRLAGVPGNILHLDSNTLKSLQLLGTDEQPPLLRELLDMVAGQEPVYIELKSEARPESLARAVLMALKGYSGPFALASFDPQALAWLRRAEPDAIRVQIATDFRHKPHPTLREKVQYRRLRHLRLSRPHAVAYDLRALPFGPVERFRRIHGPVLAWTARSPAEFSFARQHADNVIFEGIVPEESKQLD